MLLAEPVGCTVMLCRPAGAMICGIHVARRASVMGPSMMSLPPGNMQGPVCGAVMVMNVFAKSGFVERLRNVYQPLRPAPAWTSKDTSLAMVGAMTPRRPLVLYGPKNSCTWLAERNDTPNDAPLRAGTMSN